MTVTRIVQPMVSMRDSGQPQLKYRQNEVGSTSKLTGCHMVLRRFTDRTPAFYATLKGFNLCSRR